MKLADITRVDILAEGHVEPNALMSLERVAATGVITNKFEELVLAKFSLLLKDGLFWNEPDPTFCGQVTVSTTMLSAIRSLSVPELQSFAQHILGAARVKNGSAMYCAPSMPVLDWMRLYTSREATD